MTVEFNFTKLNKLERQLKGMSKTAVPFANKMAINQAAFDVFNESRKNVRDKMTLRNKWTERSIRFKKAQGLNVDKQRAVIGSFQKYMAKQEFGGREVAKGKHGVDIPTTTASGEGQNAIPRKKLVRKANRMAAINLKSFRRSNFKSDKHRLAVRAVEAKKTGNKFAFLDMTQRKKGIYKFTNVRIGRNGKLKNMRASLVHDLSQKSIVIPKTPWLSPALNKVEKKMPRIYERELLKQFKRHTR
jgi:phage gpG-like protein